jgi:prepilin-type N-terminal cleavage/methylation domain-containing protein
MPSHRRAGFTLVELLVALVIFVLVAASLYRVLNVSQRTARTQTEKAAMQGSLRSGLQLAMAEIQELWSDDDAILPGSAITAMTATAMSYNAMRGLGLTCGTPTNTTITLRRNTWTGLLFPAANQGIYVFDEGASSATENDDLWHAGTITAVGSGTCPDGAAATVLTVSGIVASFANVKVPGPVRNHEPMQLGLVSSGGRRWLGIAGTGSLTPLAGPLKSSGTALDFKYYDDQGDITAVPSEVKSIVFRLYGETDRMATQNIGGTATILQDSMIVRVQLRNGR